MGRVEDVDIRDALIRLCEKKRIDLRNFQPGSDSPRDFSEIPKNDAGINNFFYRGSLQIRVTHDGREDFENKSELIGPQASKPLIFVSCGQSTESGKSLGKRLCGLVDATGVYQGYFAEQQQTLEGLTANIFRQLESCVGFVAVLHERGKVESALEHGYRAAVFIEQELAIVSFLNETRTENIDFIGYVQHGVMLEGIRGYLLMNPTQFTEDEQVIEDFAARIKALAGRAVV
jgi:hypothetical protein